MSYYDNRGHTTNYSGITSGASSTQHNGNVYGSVINNYDSRAQTRSLHKPTGMGRSKEDYTVGWLCALPDPEWQASRLLLDEEHEEMNVPNTRHQYIFGKMNGHGIVMGCLPEGQMGGNAAASAAAEMATTFPFLRIGLLVGVGGGVPSEDHDIRLGDVVVSRPDMVHKNGGVIQYDFGKAIQGEGFVQTGILNLPPTTLLAALGKVRAQRPSQSKFLEYLKSFKRYEEQLPQYAARPSAEDKLFEASYVHPKGNRTCKVCTDEVDREARPSLMPVVHFGTIASGNQVMKDALRRDELAEQHNVLCFEEEAAGLMNQFPCIVIRGICDYCDSHKNKAWQPYAAAVAAAWAKELLRNVSPASVVEERTLEQESGSDVAHRAIYVVPSFLQKAFVGRAGCLAELEHILLKSDKHTKAALVGMPGVGKSQIALQYAKRLHKQRPDVSVLWVHASGIESFSNSYHGIAAALRLPGCKDPKADMISLVSTWLRGEASGTWILILDNADDISFVHQTSTDISGNPFVLSDYAPEKPGCSVLLTTFDRRVGERFVGNPENVLGIECITEDDAMALLRAETPERVSSDDDARALAVLLDCIPLALCQAAAYIMQYKTMTIRRYSQLLHDNEQSLLTDDPDDLADGSTGAPRSVLKTLELSLGRVLQTRSSAIKLLSWLCFLDKHNIPLNILVLSPFHHDIEKDIETLSRFCLIRTKERQSAADSYVADMHRLVQIAARKWVSSRQENEQMNGFALLRLDESYPSGEYENWQTCQILEPHAEIVLAQELQATCSITTSYRFRLTYHRCTYRRHRGMYAEAGIMAERLLPEVVRHHGPQHERTMQILVFIAHCNLELGNWSRISPNQEKALLKHHGDSIPSLAYFVRKHIARRDGYMAEQLCKRLIQKSIALHDKHGAEPLYDKHGAEHRDTLSAKSELARAYQVQEKLIRAKTLMISVLNSRQRLFTINDPDALASVSDLAGLFVAEGRLESAARLYDELWQRRALVLGEQHALTLHTMNNLAAVRLRQGRVAHASTLISRVLAIRNRTSGHNDPAVLESEYDTAYTLWQSGRLQEARIAASESLKNIAQVLGKSDPLVLTVKAVLAKILLSLGGELSNVRRLITDSMEGSSKQYGPGNPSTLVAREVLSMVEVKEGNSALAWKLQTKIWQRLNPDPQRAIASGNYASAIECMLRMSIWHETSGSRDLAMDLVDTAVVLSRRTSSKHLTRPSVLISVTMDPSEDFALYYHPAKYEVVLRQSVQPLFHDDVGRLERREMVWNEKSRPRRSQSQSRGFGEERSGLHRRWSIA